MGALKINVSSVDGQSWPLVLHQTLNQKSTGWGPGIKFLNTSDSSGKWAGIGGMSGSEYANNNDLVFYTSAEARFRMNNNTFYPIGDAIYNLGGPTVRWQDVYGVNFRGDSAILKGEYALRFTNINTEAYLAANSSEGLFLAVYGSGNSGKSIYLETYNTDIYHRKNGTNYKILTPNNGGFYTLTREDVGNSYNIDNLTFNGFFEVRASNEVTVSGAKPWDGYYGCVNFHEGVCKMQIAGSNLYGFAIRGIQKANATLANVPWHTLLTSANYNSYSPTLTGGGASGTWGINITGSASNADTLDGYHADSFASVSGSNNYVKVYNSNNVVGSSSVTFNDLAKQGFAAAMIHAAEDNPTGAARWCHAISMAWGAGSNTDWISQLAFGVQDSNGLWYRTNSSACVGKPWKRVLDSSNYNSYSPTLTGGGASGTWGINISGNATSASYLAHPLHMHGGNTGKPCYPCFARITVTGTYASRPGMIILSSRDRYLCNLQIRFDGGNSTDPGTLYLHHDSGDSYHSIFAVKVQAGVWDLYYSKSQDWDDITVYQYSSADFSISFPGGYITSIPSNRVASVPLPNRGTVPYGNSKPTHEDFAGMIYYQLI